MFSSRIRSPRSKTILHLAAGVGISLVSVPDARAVTTALASASLSFTVSSSQGPLGFSPYHLNGTANLTAEPPATTAGYSNSTDASSLSSSASIGVNKVSTASTVSGQSFSSSASVDLSLPPFSTSEGRASSYNFVNIDTLHIVPVDDMFDLKFSSVHARLNLSLGDDADGVSAFGGASWFVSLRYSMPNETEGGSNSYSITRSIGTDGSYSDTNNYSTSFTFNSIPASATNVQLYWETTAEARAVDGGPLAQPVPDGGSSLGMLGAGMGALAILRRKFSSSRNA